MGNCNSCDCDGKGDAWQNEFNINVIFIISQMIYRIKAIISKEMTRVTLNHTQIKT